MRREIAREVFHREVEAADDGSLGRLHDLLIQWEAHNRTGAQKVDHNRFHISGRLTRLGKREKVELRLANISTPAKANTKILRFSSHNLIASIFESRDLLDQNSHTGLECQESARSCPCRLLTMIMMYTTQTRVY